MKFDLLDSYKTNVSEKEFRFDKCGKLVIGHQGNMLKRELFDRTGYECGDIVLAEAVGDDRIYNIDGRKLQRLISFSNVKLEDTLKVKQRVLF